MSGIGPGRRAAAAGSARAAGPPRTAAAPWTAAAGRRPPPEPLPEPPGGNPQGPWPLWTTVGPPLFQGMTVDRSCLAARPKCAGGWRNVRPAPYRMASRVDGGLPYRLTAARFATRSRWPGHSNRIAPWPPPQDALREALRAITDPASGAGHRQRRPGRGHRGARRPGAGRRCSPTGRTPRRWSRCGARSEALLARQPGVTNATAVLTAHKAPGAAAPAAGGGGSAARRGRRRAAGMAGGTAWPAAGRAEAGAAAAGGEGDRRGGLRQGRRRQIHRGGEPGGGAGAAGASRSACWTPTSTARACRACWG